MARRRRSRTADRPTPGDLEHAPETGAVRLPPREEQFRGENQDLLGERDPGAFKKPTADATGEGNVTELAQDFDDESVRTLEKNSGKTQPRAAPHPHRSRNP